MLIPKSIDPKEIISQNSSGLYHYIDEETESSGWNKMEHYYYALDSITMWSISFCSDNYHFTILKENDRISSVSSEVFFEYVKNKTPDAIDWIIFNIEILGGKNDKK